MPGRKFHIRKVAVLGSGTMGSQIAAHCVNAGLEVLLLDLKKESGDPNQTVKDNIARLRKMNPAPLALPDSINRIEPGNFEDDFEKLTEADWICEAVVEKMEIKRDMMDRIDEIRSEHTVVSSNTSGLPIGSISKHCSKPFRQHFLGTHFFNPPRYMKLLELIPTEDTSAGVIEKMGRFCERTLGKGVVLCNDTPNFIANRIGIFSMASIMPWFFDGSFRAEEIDYLTGTLTGYSKAATFRTADLSGLDIIQHVSKNLYPAIPDDERREVFDLPDAFEKMVEKGRHGNKTGEGIYKKVQTGSGREYKVINPDTFEYESQTDPESTFEIAKEAGKKETSPGGRLRYLVNSDGRVGDFLWKIQCDLLLYSARRLPEITPGNSGVEAIDRAMKWGFNWELGPFERWDAIGVKQSVERMQSEGLDVPGPVLKMLEEGRKVFYDREKGTVYNPVAGKEVPLSPPAEGALTVRNLRSDSREVLSNSSAGLYNMGEGVALFEFRTKKHTLGFELVETLAESCEKVEQEFDALVIGHDGDDFTYGANLMEVLQMWRQGAKEELRRAVENFQLTAVGLRSQPFPVVVAPFGRTLGGGTEFVLHADRVVAHHELYAGLVEAGVGVIPAGGGTKEMLRRAMQRVTDEDRADPLPYVKEVFKLLGMAEVSSGAPEAKEMGFLREEDTIIMNRDLLFASARREARTLADLGYQPPRPASIKVMGREGFSALKLMLYIMSESGYITEYDRVVGEKLAWVMSGGDLSEPQEVSEEYILKLEQDAFMELLEDERTIARIEHMLKKGKPLRN